MGIDSYFCKLYKYSYSTKTNGVRHSVSYNEYKCGGVHFYVKF